MKKLNCVMLVDDDATTNFINELLISEIGITDQLLIATNGEEALIRLKEDCLKRGFCPDLILLDINMPVMDGFQFLEEFNALDFRSRTSAVVIMVTTSLNPADVEKAKELNVKGYINKPLVEQDLMYILQQHFNFKQD